MLVINFFRNLFESFGKLLGFMETKITLPSLDGGLIISTNPSVQSGWYWGSSFQATLWDCCGLALVGFLTFALMLHIYHLAKPIG